MFISFDSIRNVLSISSISAFIKPEAGSSIKIISGSLIKTLVIRSFLLLKVSSFVLAVSQLTLNFTKSAAYSASVTGKYGFVDCLAALRVSPTVNSSGTTGV